MIDEQDAKPTAEKYRADRVPYLMFLEWLIKQFGTNRLISNRELDRRLHIDSQYTTELFDDSDKWLGHETKNEFSRLGRACGVLALLTQNWPYYYAVVIEIGDSWAVLPTAKTLLQEYDRKMEAFSKRHA